MGPQTFWDSFGRFLSPRHFLLSPLSACILQFLITAITLLYRSFSLKILAFCTIATLVAVHILGDLANFPSIFTA